MSAEKKSVLPGASNDAAASAATSLADVATGATELVRAWWVLLEQELKLAKHSMRLLLACTVAMPVLALSAWLGLSALLVAVAQVLTNSWVAALVLGCAVQVIAFCLLLRRMRVWWRDLSLPQSRAALGRAMERMS